MKIKMIKFGEEYKEWPDDRKIRYLEKLASAMNEAAAEMEKERDEAFAFAKNAERQIKAASELRDAQIEITTKQLLESNSANQRNLQLIQRLQDRIRAQDLVIEKLNGSDG